MFSAKMLHAITQLKACLEEIERLEGELGEPVLFIVSHHDLKDGDLAFQNLSIQCGFYKSRDRIHLLTNFVFFESGSALDPLTDELLEYRAKKRRDDLKHA